jgi:hypothetical protein
MYVIYVIYEVCMYVSESPINFSNCNHCTFPALPDFLSSSGSGTGSTQPREVN